MCAKRHMRRSTGRYLEDSGHVRLTWMWILPRSRHIDSTSEKAQTGRLQLRHMKKITLQAALCTVLRRT